MYPTSPRRTAEATRRRRLGRGRPGPFVSTCAVLRGAGEKVFSDLGRARHLKKKGADRRRRLRPARKKARAAYRRRARVDVVFGPPDRCTSPAADARGPPARRPPAGRSAFPEIEVLTYCRRRRVEARRLSSRSAGGLQLKSNCSCCRARSPAARFCPPVRESAGRGGGPSARRPGTSGERWLLEPERQRLTAADAARTSEIMSPTSAMLIEHVAEIRASSVHPPPPAVPNRMRPRRLIDVYAPQRSCSEPPGTCQCTAPTDPARRCSRVSHHAQTRTTEQTVMLRAVRPQTVTACPHRLPKLAETAEDPRAR